MTDIREDTPECNSDNNDFDWKKAQLIVPPRTSVWAYIDDRTGDLLISASDGIYQTDADIRINAEDIVDFIDRLTDLVGWPSAGAPRESSRNVPTKPKDPTASEDVTKLDGDVTKRRGRPPAGEQPLTATERKRRQRQRDTAVEGEPELGLVKPALDGGAA